MAAQFDPKYYPERYNIQDWLPGTARELKLRGWDALDVVLFTGDAYVDHPAFGASVIGRVLEHMGLRVGLVAQPNWKDDLRDFKKLGMPRLFFGITSGNMDSMVNHYTAQKRLRSTDAYTPGNQSGFRPDRAVEVYASILRKLYPESLIIAGGIEASLRRLTHFDYWSDSLRPSVLASGNIDYLIYGMGDKVLTEVVDSLKQDPSGNGLEQLPQIGFATKEQPKSKQESTTVQYLHSHELCLESKKSFAENFVKIETASNQVAPATLIQQAGDRFVVINPPAAITETAKLDKIHALPYTRLPHPKYWKKDLIPAFEMIRFSVNIHRGCFGGCSFCTISAHQGKFIESRSEESVIQEVKTLVDQPGFTGHLSDLGGPSANMYQMQGRDLNLCHSCSRPSCIHPGICANLDTSHEKLLVLYEKVRKIPGIKKAFVSSGIRYDLFNRKQTTKEPSHKKYPEVLVQHHVSGRLKVAPEHTEDEVLKQMRKPAFKYFELFRDDFNRINQKHQLKQQLIPYFISAHPACDLNDMAELAARTKEMNFRLQQVQELTPTPMTLSAVMYYTGLDPYTMQKIHVSQDLADKKDQSRLFFWYKPEEQSRIRQLLFRIKREDLLQELLPKPFVKHKRSKKRR